MKISFLGFSQYKYSKESLVIGINFEEFIVLNSIM